MFEVTYKQNSVVKHHIDVTFEQLFKFVQAHQEGKIKLLCIEDLKHHVYDIESLSKNLKI